MNAGHNYKLEMLAWKAVTEKDWGVVENNENKIILLWSFTWEGEYDPWMYGQGNISNKYKTDFISEYGVRKIVKEILCLLSGASTSKRILRNLKELIQ